MAVKRLYMKDDTNLCQDEVDTNMIQDKIMFGTHKKEPLDISNFTLTEVMNKTRDMGIREGGLKLILEKIVMEIEEIKLKIGD